MENIPKIKDFIIYKILNVSNFIIDKILHNLEILQIFINYVLNKFYITYT